MSPRVYCTNIAVEMPALVRTHSSSSTDSSVPSTPVTESGSPFEFDAIKLKAVQVEVPILSRTSSSQSRRYSMAQHEVVETNKDVDHESIQLVQMLFLLAMLLVDVLRVLSWVPICLWIIMGEVWGVAKHELQIDVKKAAVNGGIVAVVAIIVGFLLL